MDQKDPKDITFQLTVGQLTVSSRLPKQDIHVTVSVGDLSKITCSGELSDDGLIVTWNHPFLFLASSSATVAIGISSLPEELTPQWDKQPLGDQVVVDVVSLLKSGSAWQFDVTGTLVGPANLSVLCMISNVLIASDGHDCLSSLNKKSMELLNAQNRFRSMACAFTKIEVNLAALDLCPLGNAKHITVLNNLGVSFHNLYHLDGNIVHLNRAIEIQKTRLDLCPLGHSDHAQALQELALSLGAQYYIQKNKNDLNRLIEMQERLLFLCPLDHPRHAKVLQQYAQFLSERYFALGNMADLNRSIEMGEASLNLCPIDNPSYGGTLGTLSASLTGRYRKEGNPMDLDRIINLSEQRLELCPSEHPFHGLALQNLAVSLWDRYKKMQQNHFDLNRAIMLFREALEFYPIHHNHFAFNVAQLALLLLITSQSPYSPGEIYSPAVNDPFEVYRLLKKCGPAASVDLWKATQQWVQDAEKYNHSSVLEAYQTSLNTLDHFTSLNSSLDSRHETIQAKVADMVNDAFSCSARHGDFQTAVELLEQGRGILWNQLARFDISIALLESQGSRGHELGRKFTQLSVDLRKHAQGSGTQDLGPYWRVREQWQSVVDEIRRLDGFSRFLLPPHFKDLQHAAECGPVIVVNASKYTCDALIVLHSRSPVRVSLPCTLTDVEQLCLQLSELTQDAHAYGENRESYVKEMLRELWSCVVEPIASVLQDDVELLPGSRIWWCPTSKFTTLPLHAAGPYRKGQKNFMDIYISSYAPSLSGLIRTRERVRSQKNARNAAGTMNQISFAAVGQARPSADTKLGELVEVVHEIQRIRNETGMPPDVKFETVIGKAATIDGAVQAFRDHRWVHVACHGAQHAKKPFESWFAMGDGKLTLMRIIQERYTNSEFAFLSACHTAVGDKSTPDEVLHLAAGMQFAGFNGVIGTLWRVDDAVAHLFVTRFYKEMFKHPDINFGHAAEALNIAALETSDEVSLEKRIVFVHIGI